jgi:hypothetical protein
MIPIGSSLVYRVNSCRRDCIHVSPSGSLTPTEKLFIMQMSQIRRAARAIALVAVAVPLLSASSCSDKITGNRTAQGAYVLVSIEQDGHAECTIGSSGCTIHETGEDVIVVESSTLNLVSDGSFTFAANGTRNGTSELIGGATGTWVETQSGATLSITGVPVSIPATFTSANADGLVFVLPAQTLSATQGTVTLTFDKQ